MNNKARECARRLISIIIIIIVVVVVVVYLYEPLALEDARIWRERGRRYLLLCIHHCLPILVIKRGFRHPDVLSGRSAPPTG
jgi:hypothetical protein